MGFFQTTAKGVSWLAGLRGVIRGLTFLRLFYLARLLTPAQFGTFGVATLVLAFVEVLTETGVNIVLVQENRATFEKYLNSAWVVSILRGMLIFVIMVITAPLVTRFFDNDDALPLIFLLSFVPLIKGFINPSIVLFQKELRFKSEVMFRSSIVISGTIVTILLAVITRSPISLALGMLFESILEVTLSFMFISVRPSLHLNKVHFLHIFHRGKWITIAGIFNYLYQQMDDIVVGRKLNPTDLGYYQMAYRLAMLPMTEIAEVFNRVTFPVYTHIIQDKQRLRYAFFRTTGFITLLSCAFGTVLFLFPSQIVHFVLGPQWLAIVSILPVLAVTGAIRGVSISSFSLFLALKKQEFVTYSTITSIVVLGILVIPLTSTYGLLGASFAALIGSVAALPLIALYTYKVLKT